MTEEKKNNKQGSKRATQKKIVERQFLLNDISLEYLNAGRSLYNSLNRAKERTKKNESYVNKGIKFRFNDKPRFALIEVIKEEPSVWEDWIALEAKFEETGNERERPSIHRLNPDSHYEKGNIAAVTYREQQTENAIETPVLLVKDGQLQFGSFESVSFAQDTLGLSKSEFKKLSKEPVTTIKYEEGSTVHYVNMTYTQIKHEDEAARKKWLKEKGLGWAYQSKEEANRALRKYLANGGTGSPYKFTR